MSSIFYKSSRTSYLKVRRAVPGFSSKKDLVLDVLVRSVLYPKLLDELLEPEISAITLLKSIRLKGSAVSVSSVTSSTDIIRGVEFRSAARR